MSSSASFASPTTLTTVYQSTLTFNKMRFSTAVVLAFLSGLAAAKNATELEALVTDPTNPQNLINCPPGGGADGCHLETKVSNLHRQSLCIDADALSVQAHPHQLRVQLQRALHLVSCGRSVSLEAFRSPRGRVGTTTTSTRCPMASASRSTTRVLAEVLKHRGT